VRKIKSIKLVWKKLRSHYWGALVFDVMLIAVVFWGIQAWQTRYLPIGEFSPSLPDMSLDSNPQTAPVPAGQGGVIYFFAPWCSYCRYSIVNLDDLVRSGSIGWARTVALDYGNISEVQAFVDETGLKLPVLLGDAGTALEWRISAFPTYFVIGPDGRIKHHSVGYSTQLGMWWRTRF
jgi:thiol-disulfide isomerase/thioredoxin